MSICPKCPKFANPLNKAHNIEETSLDLLYLNRTFANPRNSARRETDRFYSSERLPFANLQNSARRINEYSIGSLTLLERLKTQRNQISLLC